MSDATQATAGGPMTVPADQHLEPEEIERALGRDAERPLAIPLAGWKQVGKRTVAEMMSDQMGLAAAGCAFYATLALFPAISTLISLYGLVFDPATVEPQLRALQRLLPGVAYTMITDRVHELVSRPRGSLTIGLIVSIAIALWSTSASTKAILSALNIAYDQKESRGFVRFQATALAMTLCAILGAIMTISLLIFLPAAVQFLPERLGLTWVNDQLKWMLSLATPVALIVFVSLAFTLLYRYGPSRAPARWPWIAPGVTLATALWLIASWGFSFYVSHFASYDATYGPLGAVAAIMMWFFVTAFVVLLGAELNSELELQTRRDSTTRPEAPPGERGAFVADHVAQG
ncbi:membrane protein [Endobacter medicaginis]|uniref:Membrane protein n=1 Tax=Endobacter medicaginis TaxID=1181271 RepID=A0A850NXT1_9PROT|nr:YihY/virulence factor BrkB family protein [Endobacter medicaginis]MBB3172479.1 membrane protein [Endobacter medicaginis]MCX5474032.1 YihY/virulence factor BrkB family protein [Endobacter medicaginis]NVN30707.1 YihY/virulence factor BrkB family protein [Endobacter medicaginis]